MPTAPADASAPPGPSCDVAGPNVVGTIHRLASRFLRRSGRAVGVASYRVGTPSSSGLSWGIRNVTCSSSLGERSAGVAPAVILS